MSRFVVALLSLVSASAFVFYGLNTLLTQRIQDEFDRYGAPKLRVFVGVAHLLGAAGLLLRPFSGTLAVVAAAGLTTLMLIGLLVRCRIGDQPRLMMPAASLAAINGLLVALHFW